MNEPEAYKCYFMTSEIFFKTQCKFYFDELYPTFLTKPSQLKMLNEPDHNELVCHTKFETGRRF